MKDMVRILEIDESEHLFPLLLCSFLLEVLVGSEKGNGQLVKKEGGKIKEKQG